MAISIRKKIRVAGVILIGVALAAGALLFNKVNSLGLTCQVPVLNKAVEKGQIVAKADISFIEMGIYNNESLGIIVNPLDIESSYAVRNLSKNTVILKDDVTKDAGELGIKGAVKVEAITIKTDFSKSLVGKISKGDFVRTSIVGKKSGSLEISQPESLSRLKVVELADKNGREWKEGDKENIGMSNEISFITLEASPKQQKLLVQGMYGGDLHFALIPYEGK